MYNEGSKRYSEPDEDGNTGHDKVTRALEVTKQRI